MDNKTSVEIIRIVSDHLGVNPDDIEKDALLREDLGLNTIELNDLLGILAEKFNISFNPHEAQSIETVEDLIQMTEDSLLDSEI